MKAFAISFVSSVCVLAALTSPQASHAQTQLVFQTTFNCPDWNQTMGLGDAIVCTTGDGISGGGGWTSSNGSVDQIVTAANNPAGVGGKGFRHWVGDGLNNGGGGISVVPPAPGLSDIYIRYYIRFQAGFTWGSPINMKTLYINSGSQQGGSNYFGLSSGEIGGTVQAGGSQVKRSGVSWSNWQGGPVGDGLFHCLELHLKMNSGPGLFDGAYEIWLDNVQIYSDKNTFFSDVAGAKFEGILVGSNHNNPQNGGVDAYVDFDDIAISAGRVGCTGFVGLAAPRNLRIQ